MIGARFSSSVAGSIPPNYSAQPHQPHPCSSTSSSSSWFSFLHNPSDESPSHHDFPSIRSNHTATARRHLHALCMPLGIFLKFFPDTDIEMPSQNTEDNSARPAKDDDLNTSTSSALPTRRSDYSRLPTSPALNPFTHATPLAFGTAEDLFAAPSDTSPTRLTNRQQLQQQQTPTNEQQQHNATTASNSVVQTSQVTKQKNTTQLVHSVSEYVLPLSAMQQSSNDSGSSTMPVASIPPAIDFDPSVPINRSSASRRSTLKRFSIGALSGLDTSLLAATPAQAASSTYESTSSSASSAVPPATHTADETRLARMRPSELYLTHSESEPIVGIAPTDHTHSISITNSTALASTLVLTGGVTAGFDGDMTRSASSNSLQHPTGTRIKLWHVLPDAVDTQSQSHARRSHRQSDGGISSGSMPSSQLVSSRVTVAGPSSQRDQAHTHLVTSETPLNHDDDLAAITQNESDEIRIKRRMRFFRGVTLGNIHKWSHDRLLQFCMKVRDHRYTNRTHIYRQFDHGTSVFFIHTGSVQLQRSVTEGSSHHYLDMYTDHITNEKLLHRSHAKSTLDVTTGTGVLREVSFEAVLSHRPNPGQEDLTHALARVKSSTHGTGGGGGGRGGVGVGAMRGAQTTSGGMMSSHSTSNGSAVRRGGSGTYTLLREFDYVARKLHRSTSHYFALFFEHTGHSLRFTLQAHRGTAEIYVCTQALLPGASKFTWMGSTQLSAKENAYFNATRSGAGNSSSSSNSEKSGINSNLGMATSTTGSLISLSTIHERAMEEKTSSLTTTTPADDVSSSNATSSSSSSSVTSSVRTHSCEVVIQPPHPSYRLGWFYVCVTSPRGSGSCDYTLRVSGVPNVVQSGVGVGSGGGGGGGGGTNMTHTATGTGSGASKAPITTGLAVLGKGGYFGLDSAINHAGRDEEAIAVSDSFIYSIARDDFLAFFPPLAGNPNPHLVDMIRMMTSVRQHRATLHQDALRLVKQIHDAAKVSGTIDHDLHTIDLTLEHYSKLDDDHAMLGTALQRYEVRQANRAKMKLMAAQRDASGVIAKKPILSSDIKKARINHGYVREDRSKLKRTETLHLGNGLTVKRAHSPKPSYVTASSSSASASGSGASSSTPLSLTSTSSPVEATGTTGPSQHHVRSEVAAQVKNNVLQDELTQLQTFLANEARDHRPNQVWATPHAALVSKQAAKVHKLLLAETKSAHGIPFDRHIALDMHALMRKDVGVHEDEVAQIASQHSLDDIVANRVPIPIPPPERLLSTEEDARKMKLDQAPKFEPVRPHPEPPGPEPIRRSEVYIISGDLMKAQLAPLVGAHAAAGASTKTGDASPARSAHSHLPTLTLAPPQTHVELDALERAFAREVPPSNWLALETGEYVPQREIHSSPRLVNPSRRERRRVEEERQNTLTFMQDRPTPTKSPARRPKTAGPTSSSASSSTVASKQSNVRTVRGAIAVYPVDDPSLDSLRQFNRSLDATYAREHEFTRANRAAGYESRPIEWTTMRPATRASHPLAPMRLESKADQAPLQLWTTKVAPPKALLQPSASEPLLLMPPTSTSAVHPQKHPLPNVDSNIFDLTSVDAHEQEQEQEGPSDSARDPDLNISFDPDRSLDSSLIDELAHEHHHEHDRTERQNMHLSSSPIPTRAHIHLPSTGVASPDLSQSQRDDGDDDGEYEDRTLQAGSHRSFTQDDAESKSVVPFETHSASTAVSNSPAVSLVAGIPLPHLPLEGLSAGPLDVGLPTLGDGYQMPSDPRALPLVEFPPRPLSRETLLAQAAQEGLIPPPPPPPARFENSQLQAPLTHARLVEHSHTFERARHHASQLSSPLAEKESKRVQRERCIGGVQTPMEREAYVQALEEEVRRQEEIEAHRSTTTTMSEEAKEGLSQQSPATLQFHRAQHLTDANVVRIVNDRSPNETVRSEEVWDVDDLIHQMSKDLNNTSVTTSSPSLAQRPSSHYQQRDPRQRVDSASTIRSGLRSAHSTSSLHHRHASSSSTLPSTGRVDLVISSASMSSLHDPSASSSSSPTIHPIGFRHGGSTKPSKHGHPARIGPAYLSNSSADVPAMVWLAERVKARGGSSGIAGDVEGGGDEEEEILRRHIPVGLPTATLSSSVGRQTRSRSVSRSPSHSPTRAQRVASPSRSIDRDTQAIVRPVSAPMAAFDKKKIRQVLDQVKPHLSTAHAIKPSTKKPKQVKTYFQPHAQRSVAKAGPRSVQRSLQRSITLSSPIASPKVGPTVANEEQISEVNLEQTHSNSMNNTSTSFPFHPSSLASPSSNSIGDDRSSLSPVPLSPTGSVTSTASSSSTSLKRSSQSTLLNMLESLGPNREAVWSLKKTGSGTISTHFTRRSSLTFSVGTAMDDAFLAAISKPLTPAEAEQAQKEFHERRITAEKARAAKQHQKQQQQNETQVENDNSHNASNVINSASHPSTDTGATSAIDSSPTKSNSPSSSPTTSAAALLPSPAHRMQSTPVHRRGASVSSGSGSGSVGSMTPISMTHIAHAKQPVGPSSPSNSVISAFPTPAARRPSQLNPIGGGSSTGHQQTDEPITQPSIGTTSVMGSRSMSTSDSSLLEKLDEVGESLTASVTASPTLSNYSTSTSTPTDTTSTLPSLSLSLPTRHPLDRPSSFLLTQYHLPPKLKSLPVPTTGSSNVYAKPKINPYVNAPMQR